MIVTKIYGPILAILSQLTTLLNLNVVTERMKTLLTTPAMSGKEETPQTYNIKLNDVSLLITMKMLFTMFHAQYHREA